MYNQQKTAIKETMKQKFHIQWHVTGVCNLRCRHCYQESYSRKTDLKRDELQAVAENIFEALRSWNKSACISLTGGEPLLKLELFDLLKYLGQNPTVNELEIITNGLLIDNINVQELSALKKLKKIKISLDGATAAVNDSIRGKGTFEKITRSISVINKTASFDVVLMFTAMNSNFRNIVNFLELAQSLKVSGLIIERFIPLGKGKELGEEVLSANQWNEMLDILCRLFFIESRKDLLSYQAFAVDLSKAEPELSGARCVLGSDGLCIMDNGDVFPCRRLPLSLGNLLREKLNLIWSDSEILKKVRQKKSLKGKCRRCKIKHCRGCRSLAYALTGDYLAEDAHCLEHVPI